MESEIRAGIIDAQGRVAVDAACLRCGYNLRMLPMAGRCPECGTAVGRTLVGDLLRYSDARWLRSVGGGLGLLVVTLAASLAITTFGAIMFPFQVGHPPTLAGLEMLVGAAAVVGAVRFARREPDAIRPTASLDARRWVWIAAVSQILAAAAQYTWVQFALMPRWLGPLPLAANLVLVFLVLRSAQLLAGRIPSANDERTARKLLAGFEGGAGLLAFGWLAGRVWPRSQAGLASISIGLTMLLALCFATILFLARLQRTIAAMTGRRTNGVGVAPTGAVAP